VELKIKINSTKGPKNKKKKLRAKLKKIIYSKLEWKEEIKNK
jgi:malonyl CoA-acyl carrier protein transacylase